MILICQYVWLIKFELPLSPMSCKLYWSSSRIGLSRSDKLHTYVIQVFTTLGMWSEFDEVALFSHMCMTSYDSYMCMTSYDSYMCMTSYDCYMCMTSYDWGATCLCILPICHFGGADYVELVGILDLFFYLWNRKTWKDSGVTCWNSCNELCCIGNM